MLKINLGKRPLIILAAFVFTLLTACALRFRGHYAYFDDFTFVVDADIPALPHWMSIGRPGTFIYLKVVQYLLGGDLILARVMGGVFVAACSIIIHTAMTKRGHSIVASTAVALSLPAATAIQISLIWVNTASTTIALLLAVGAYWVGLSTWQKFTCSTVLMILSALVYQPSACFIFVLFLLDWLLLPRRSGIRVNDISTFLPGAIGLAVSFATSKISAAIMTVNQNWAGRGALVNDISGKITSLSNDILPVVFNPIFPHLYDTKLWPFFASMAFCLFFSIIRIRRLGQHSWIDYCWSILITVGYLIAAGLPVLIVQENWPSYRTLVPWSVLAIVSLTISASYILPRAQAWKQFAVGAFIVLLGLLNASTISRYLIKPEVGAMEEFTRQVKQGVLSGYSKFGLILAPAGPYAWQFKTLELGWLSASANWPPAGMLVMAEKQIGLQPKQLSYAFVGYKVETCKECYIIDMRPYWKSLFDKYALKHWEQQEQEAAEKRQKSTAPDF